MYLSWVLRVLLVLSFTSDSHKKNGWFWLLMLYLASHTHLWQLCTGGVCMYLPAVMEVLLWKVKAPWLTAPTPVLPLRCGAFPWVFACKWAKALSVLRDGLFWVGALALFLCSLSPLLFGYKQWSHNSRGAGIHAIWDDVIGSQSTCWGGDQTSSVLSQLLPAMWRFCTCSVSFLLAGPGLSLSLCWCKGL